jgi:hypothetical protein
MSFQPSIAFTSCAVLLASASLYAQAPQFRYLARHGLQRDADPTFKIAAGDVNGDGAMDIVCANMGSTMPGTQNRLYLNDGVGNLTDVTATHLPAAVDWTGAVELGDIDGDGDLDIFFGNAAAQGSRLYLNDGTGRFTDVTAARGIATTRTVYAAAMADVDFDRDLDIIARDYLFLNDGRGFFTDVSATHLPGTTAAWGMAVGDVDFDRDLDIVYAGVNAQPQLWLNDGTGKFVDATSNLPQMQVDSRGTFGLADVDFDRDLDLYFPNNLKQNQLWLNDGTGMFTDVTATNLPVELHSEYAATLVDVDGDFDVDALTANSSGGATPFQNRLYLNDGRGVFTDATATRMGNLPSVSVALAATDLDQDGDADIVYGNWNPSNEIWFNHHRHVYAENGPTIGANYDLDTWGEPGYATLPQVAIPFLGYRPLVPRVAIPGFGQLGVNPSPLFILNAATIPVPGGKSTIRLPIPNDSSLRGLPIYMQSLVFQSLAYHLTNVFPDRIQ